MNQDLWEQRTESIECSKPETLMEWTAEEPSLYYMADALCPYSDRARQRGTLAPESNETCFCPAHPTQHHNEVWSVNERKSKVGKRSI